MTSRENDKKRVFAARPGSSSNEVGYGKPPVRSRFRPGRSGNPSGRPRGSKNRPRQPHLNEERLRAIVLEEAHRTVNISDANGQATIPMIQAIVRSLAVNAAKGNPRAQRLFTELLAAVERDNKRLHDEWLASAIEYKVEWEGELERRKKLGIDAPAPVPHPDDIIIDMQTGRVIVNGPLTQEEKVIWDKLRQRKRDGDRQIAELEDLLIKAPTRSARQTILRAIKKAKKLNEKTSKAIPD